MTAVLFYDAELIEEGGEAVGGTVRVDLEIGPVDDPRVACDIALGSPLVPQPGNAWSTNNPYLNCIKRNAYVIKPGNPVAVMVECAYELLRFKDAVSEGGNSSLEQEETWVDKNDAPIPVTWNGHTQFESVNVPLFRGNFVEHIVIETPDPQGFQSLVMNTVNSGTFRGRPSKTVLCSGMDYIPKIRSLNWYEFTAEFQVNPKGHYYLATYKNPDGKAADPGDANAVRWVTWHEELDFNAIFGG